MKRIHLASIVLVAACARTPADTDIATTSPNLVTVPGTSTLQVVNNGNVSYRISAMPAFNPAIPQPATGVLGVATVAPGTTCLALPAEIDDIATNVDTRQVDTLRWFDSSTLEFYVVAGNSGTTTGTTEQVAPHQSPGWTLSIARDGSAQLTAGEACTP